MDKQPYYPPPPQTYGGPPSYGGLGSTDFQQPSYSYVPPSGAPPPQGGSTVRINDKPRYQDVWAAVLFGLLLAAFAVLAAFSIPSIRADASGTNPMPIKDMAVVLVIGIAVSSVLSILYYQLMLRYPSFLIKATLVFAVVSNFALCFFFFAQGQFGAGVIWLVMAVLFGFMYWSWRARIPFAALVLENVLSVARAYPSLFVVSVVQLLLTIAWTILWSITTIGLTIRFSSSNGNSGSNNGSTAPQIILWIFSLFSMYWTAQVIATVAHVTTAGLFASYYFMGVHNPATQQIDIPIPSPVMKSFSRATTTSFGSICFGSLIIAVIQTLKALARSFQSESQREGNACGAFVACCLVCILNCLGDLVEYFNSYAFVEVAIYGKDYISAAKDTWQLCKRKGIDAIINDNLVGNVLGMGTLLVGVISAAVAGVYVAFSPTIKNDWYTWAGTTNPAGVIALAAVVCLMIGLAVFGCVASVISSGVQTTFVCLAEDPQALQRTKPALFQAIQQVYPQVNFFYS